MVTSTDEKIKIQTFKERIQKICRNCACTWWVNENQKYCPLCGDLLKEVKNCKKK